MSVEAKAGWGLLGLILFLCLTGLHAQQSTPRCANCAEWNLPQEPFRVYGNTYFVGTHGLSSILITSPSGHVLIDGALAESVPQIAAHIRQLGFRVEDVKFILNSHVHFDHAGGIPELQRLSGARVFASDWSAAVMSGPGLAKDDPQYGSIPPIAPVARVETVHDGQELTVGELRLTAHLTPGHTPGGTSWTWQSCEGGKCLNFVYADSLSPASADGFKFSSPEHEQLMQGFQRSYAFLRSTPCDILLTPHPDASPLWSQLKAARLQNMPLPAADHTACHDLADGFSQQLRERIAAEKQENAQTPR
ncbi:MAG TPA: subclass B3 metallo-beta-lactamase [Terriglobales bacterium]|nr:subclass B3 metallo-beta-lactamase [Terriglobales bacterium]